MDTNTDNTTDSRHNWGCEGVTDLDRLQAERLRLMLSSEGMQYMRTTLRLKAEMLEAKANAHEACHQVFDAGITSDEYNARVALFNKISAHFEAHLRDEEAFFADIDARIAEAEARLKLRPTDGRIMVVMSTRTAGVGDEFKHGADTWPFIEWVRRRRRS